MFISSVNLYYLFEKIIKKGYSCKGMVKSYTVDKTINNKVDFAYIVDSFILWHAGLYHIDKSTMKRMLTCNLISYNENDVFKCKTCVESNMTKKPCQSVNMTSIILDLIHTNTCELNGMLTSGENVKKMKGGDFLYITLKGKSLFC